MSSLGEPIDRTVYAVREHEMVDVPLDELLIDGQVEVAPSVVGRGYFTLQLQKTALRLQARGYIGFIPINDRVAIEVRPRVSISNLARLLWLSGEGPEIIEDAARLYAHDETELPSLREFYAEALLRELAVVRALGLLREYERRMERTSSPRGRLILRSPATQLAAAGFSPTVDASWFERTADIPANRCVKMAIWLLARGYAQTARLNGDQRRRVRRLNAAYALFEDAALDTRLTFLDDPVVSGAQFIPSTRAYYRNALDIARMIVLNSSVAFDRTGYEVRMPSLVVSMEDVFEAYVRERIRSGFEARGVQWTVNDGKKEGKKSLYDESPSPDATPDVVVQAEDETFPLILDVKYKPATSNPDRDDLNQVLAYALSYRAPVAVIVQPRANGSQRHGLVELGSMGTLLVCQYVVDLNATNLDDEETALVDSVLGLVESVGEPLPLDERQVVDAM